VVGLGIVEVGVKKQTEARKKGYVEGYKKGYGDATILYKVIYHCSKCGQIIEIQNPNTKQAIDEYMREKGWGHQTCPQQ
jgi:Fe2+ or Zn2+ uptake regulation protein